MLQKSTNYYTKLGGIMGGKKEAIDIESCFKNMMYKKSNYLITGKYKSSLLENIIFAISLSKVNEFYKDEKGILVNKIKAKEIRQITGKNSGSFYTELATVAKSMTNHSIGMIDYESKIFDFYSIIIRASYKSGEFSIYYNPYMENYIVNLGKNYTKLSLKIMASFKNVYSFRLYELIKAQCYYANQDEENQNKYIITFSLSELKLELGIVDANSDEVQKVLRNKEFPDYDKAVEISTEKKYQEWRELRRCILDPSVKDINSLKPKSQEKKTDMILSYVSQKGGKGGKINEIKFFAEIISPQKESVTIDNNKSDLSIDEQIAFLDDVRKVIKEPLLIQDYRTLAELSNYNLDIISEKYKLAKKQKIDNIMGWMIDAIKNDYKLPVSKNEQMSIWDIEKHDYDFDELERLMLDN